MRIESSRWTGRAYYRHALRQAERHHREGSPEAARAILREADAAIGPTLVWPSARRRARLHAEVRRTLEVAT